LSDEIEPQVMQRRRLSEFLRNPIKKIEKPDSRVIDEQGVRVKFGMAVGLAILSAHFMNQLYELRDNFIESRDGQTSPSSMVRDEGFEECSNLLLLRARKP
jgi:hypothetical protein